MNSPESVLEKIDAARNYAGQIRIAAMVNNKTHLSEALDKLDALLFDVADELEGKEGN